MFRQIATDMYLMRTFWRGPFADKHVIFLPPRTYFSALFSLAHSPGEYSSVIEMHIYMRLNAVDVRLKRAPADEKKKRNDSVNRRMREMEEIKMSHTVSS